jgi:hypothetical protein
MSIEAMTWALALDVGDSTRKLVLIGYANHAHHDGTEAWIKVDTAAAYANCSRRTVQRHVGWLVEHGYMREGDQSAVARFRPGQRSIVYDLAMSEATVDRWAAAVTPGRRAAAQADGAIGGATAATNRRNASWGDNMAPHEEANGVTPVTQWGDTAMSPPGVTPVTQWGDTTVSPEPSMNHPLEPSMNRPVDASLRSASTSEAVEAAREPEPSLLDVDSLGEQRTTQRGDAVVRSGGQGQQPFPGGTRPEVERLCVRLADRIEANGSKRPTVGASWRDAARLMLDRDDRTVEQVEYLIDWCQADEFWRSNILSMPTLRKQFDRLRLASRRQPNNGARRERENRHVGSVAEQEAFLAAWGGGQQ